MTTPSDLPMKNARGNCKIYLFSQNYNVIVRFLFSMSNRMLTLALKERERERGKERVQFSCTAEENQPRV